jgi:hypothetical protein
MVTPSLVESRGGREYDHVSVNPASAVPAKTPKAPE